MNGTRISINGLDLNDDSRVVVDAIHVAAEHASRMRSLEIESRILTGQNDFRVGNVRYMVPTWRRHPVRRFRVELARLRFRNS